MDSSDDSFIWTDASSDAPSKMSRSIEQGVNGEESDSGYSYKKKLHKELSGEVPVKKKAKKRKRSEGLEEDTKQPKKSIKSEPESDLEIRKKKRKLENSYVNNYEISDETYLNIKVKQEEASFAEPEPSFHKSKKKRKIKKESESFSYSDVQTAEPLENEENNIDQPCRSISEVDDSIIKEQSSVETVTLEKKKKKKLKLSLNHSKNSEESSNIKKKRRHAESDISSDTEDKHNSKVENDSQIYPSHDSLVSNSVSSGDEVNNSVLDNNDKQNSQESFLSPIANASIQSNIVDSKSVKPSRIADRIRFEDEDSIDSQPREKLNNKTSSHLQQFLTINKYLTPLSSNVNKDSVITEDDEVWILKAPHEINIRDFKDVNLTLDTKWKVKLNGCSYDGVTNSSICMVPFLEGSSLIKNKSVAGTITLRKRIPKVHIPYDNIIIDNPTDFIPLPETKCRHPLFGINYRKATKISAAVAEKLHNTSVLQSSDKVKKKKHKIKKQKVEIESEAESKSTAALSEVSSKKKKHKRKHSDEGEKTYKKAKKLKHEPEAETWETEQAIENNLFNF